MMYLNMLNEYLDGELSPAESARMDAHFEACPDCRAELEALRELIEKSREICRHPY